MEEFLKIIEEINILKFPVHHRRVTLLEAKQTGDPLEFVRELIELARSAEWSTFSEESAICHLFLNSVKCDEARKICFKNSDGDSKKLIAELQTLKTLQNVDNQEGKAKSVFKANPVPNVTSKVIWRKIVGDSVKFAKGGGTKRIIAGKGMTLMNLQKPKQLMRKELLKH